MRALIDRADVVLEGLRPGVMERLSLGPDDALTRNPRLIYGRMTGWGQDGPLSGRAGHDLNYISLTGALHAMGPAHGRPTPPLNLVGDFGGGSMFLLVGVLSALLERAASGRGQVVDAAMCDGTLALSHMLYSWRALGLWSDERGANLVDGGRPWYDTYETADGRYVAVGAIEPQFYAALLRGLGLADADLPRQDDPAGWPRLREVFAAAFAGRTRAEWEAVFEGTDACVTPVLSVAEAATHPHLEARRSLVELDGVTQHAPAPRFSRTPAQLPTPPPARAVDPRSIWR